MIISHAYYSILIINLFFFELVDELKEISNVEHHFSVCDVSKIDQIRQNAQEILTLYSKIVINILIFISNYSSFLIKSYLQLIFIIWKND